MRSWIIGVALLALHLGGCGSISSTQQLRQARESVANAEREEVEPRALYEYVLAQSYLAKADVEWSQSDWKQAKRYAELAALWAERAEERARTGGAPTGVEE